MKKQFFYLSAIFAFVVIFSSCGKYDDGPAFSLRTKKMRLTHEWKIEKTYINGVEQAASANDNSTITYDSDGTGKMSYVFGTATISADIEWEFGTGKETIKVRTKNSAGAWNDWDESTILRLTNSEFWIKDTPTGTTTEYITHFAKV